MLKNIFCHWSYTMTKLQRHSFNQLCHVKNVWLACDDDDDVAHGATM